MTDENFEEALNTLQDKYDELVDKLEDTQYDLEEARSLKECIHVNDLVEIECVRCHKQFTGHPEQRYCTHDCQRGWTNAPSYEDWYRSMHPNSPWLLAPARS